MKIGIFGGTFDPVHREHVHLCKAAIESLQLDKLFVMPTYVPPHKQGKHISPADDRLAMCRLAFDSMDNVEVSDYEIQKGGTSYTYLTCRYFKQKYPDAQIFFLVGTDMFWDFFHWKEPKDILKNVTLAVCRRNEEKRNIFWQQHQFKKIFGKKFACVDYNGADISSTKIRTMSTLGLPIDEIVPQDVAEYIHAHALYHIDGVLQGLSLENEKRAAHSCRVTLLAVESATRLGLDERKVLLAASLHDCAKNISINDEMLNGFIPPKDCPSPVLHQYSGAYIAEHIFGIKEEDILNAIRYHTSGREGMSTLEKLIFLSDLLESERAFVGVNRLRKLFHKNLDECFYQSLKEQLAFLKMKKKPIYPLTKQAFLWAKENRKNKPNKEK